MNRGDNFYINIQKMYILALDSSVHTLQEAKTSTIGRYVWQYSLLSLY
jgi:hypothetical protein